MRLTFDYARPIHMVCRGRVRLPLEFGKPVECLGCGERFSAAHELGLRIVVVQR